MVQTPTNGTVVETYATTVPFVGTG